MSAGARTTFQFPKVAVLRPMIMNHTVHRRAQMGVNLSMNNFPVPSMYGPSADEGSNAVGVAEPLANTCPSVAIYRVWGTKTQKDAK